MGYLLSTIPVKISRRETAPINIYGFAQKFIN